TAVTDHRILRRSQATSANGGKEQPGKSPSLVSFYRGLSALTDEEASRNQGLALASAARIMPEGPLRNQCIEEAVPLLTAAVLAFRDDVAAWEALGFAFEKSRDARSALTVYETALSLAPNHERALVGAATNDESVGALPSALDYWQRATT